MGSDRRPGVARSSTGAAARLTSLASRCLRSTSTASGQANLPGPEAVRHFLDQAHAPRESRSTWRAHSMTSRSRWRRVRRRWTPSSPSLDRLLDPYGAGNAVPRSQQFSDWPSRTSCAASQLRVLRPGHFSRRRRFRPQHRAQPRVGIATTPVCGPQGTGILRSGARLALHQVGAGDRDGRRRNRRGGRRLDGAAMLGLYNLYFRFPTLSFTSRQPSSVRHCHCADAAIVGALRAARSTGGPCLPSRSDAA